jgi:lipopolysaccharide assembly outer membrane protein LptD (OstA)
MRRAEALFLVAWICAAFASAPTLAAEPGDSDGREEIAGPTFVVRADEVSYDQKRDLYEAAGDVRVVQSGGRTLSADWLAFNRTTQVGIATGHVRIVDRQDVVTADFAAVDLRSLVALAQNASLDTAGPGFQVRGERVQRKGVNTYSIENGTFTACRCPPGTERTPWQIETGSADVQVGGYAVARDLWFRAFGVPVLYLPWLIYPVKTERQTGFLLPSIGSSSRGGTEIETPFFLELGPSAGAVIRPTYFTDRGLKGSIEYEYVLGETGEGKLGVAGLAGDDSVSSDDPDTIFSDDDTPFSEDRWAYWVEHKQPLGEGGRLGLAVHRVSDNQYPLDFDDIAGTRNQRFMNSTGWASWAGRGWFAGISAQHFDDLQSPDDLDRDDFLLQRLPQVDVSALPGRLGGLPLRLGFDSRYAYFHQNDGVDQLADFDALGAAVLRDPIGGRFFDTGIDGLFNRREQLYRPQPNPPFAATADPHGDGTGGERSELDGRFQEGELLADDGHRLDLYPHLSLPLRLGVVETLSEVGMRETLYMPREGGNESREVWTARFDVRTRLSRSFSLGSTQMRHQLEPRVSFAALSAPDEEDNPLFIPTPRIGPQRLVEGDMRLLTRDPSDQLADARLVVAQLANRIFARPPVEGAPPRLLAEFRAGTGYDFEDNEVSRYFAEGRFHPWRALQLHLNAGWDAGEHSLEEATAAFQWLPESRHALSLGYRYRRELTRSFEEFRRDDDIFDQGDEDADRLSQVDLTSIFVVSSRLELFASGFVSLEDSSANGGELGVLLISGCRCWDLVASIEQRTRPDDTRLNLELRLSGLGRRPEVPGDLRNRRDRFLPGL